MGSTTIMTTVSTTAASSSSGSTSTAASTTTGDAGVLQYNEFLFCKFLALTGAPEIDPTPNRKT